MKPEDAKLILGIEYQKCPTGKVNEAYRMGAEAIRILMEPKHPQLITQLLFTCPSCGGILISGAFDRHNKHCQHCGQKLDWSEID